MDAPEPGAELQSRSFASRLIFLLAVLGTVLLLLANVAYWIDHTLLDSDRFTSRVGDVLARPATADRVGDVLAEQALASPTVQEEIRNALPQQAAFLPAVLHDELRDGLSMAIARVLSLDTTQEALQAALRRLHSEVILILEGKREALQTNDGALVLDLSTAVGNAFDRFGITEPNLVQNANIGQVVLLSDAEPLTYASTFVRSVKTGLPILIVGVLLSFGAYVGLSRNRVGALEKVGYCIAIAGIVTLVLWRTGLLGAGHFLGERPVAIALIKSLTTGLRLQSLGLLVVGVVLALACKRQARALIGDGYRSAAGAVERIGTMRVVVAGAAAVVVLALVS